jgi:hypothetical protein
MWWGPMGEFALALTDGGYTEASAVALLYSAIIWNGAYHYGPYIEVPGGDRHTAREFALGIGMSSAARKSTAGAVIYRVFMPKASELGSGVLVPDQPRTLKGAGSGEVLIHAWEPHKDPDGGPPIPVDEISVVMREDEASTVIKKAHRDGSVLGEALCDAWDGAKLEHHIMGASVRIEEDAYALSAVMFTTVEMFRDTFRSSMGTSGLGNRMLMYAIPPSTVDISDTSIRIPGSLIHRFRKQVGIIPPPDGRFRLKDPIPVMHSPKAKEYWQDHVYPRLKHGKGEGIIGALCGRAESHALRMSLNYQIAAGLDLRKPEISIEAVKAGEAAWDYVQASIKHIIGGATGNKEIDNLVAYLEAEGGWADAYELQRAWPREQARLVKEGVRMGIFVEGSVGASGKRKPVVGLRSMLGRMSPASGRTLTWPK